MQDQTSPRQITMPRSLFIFSLLYGGLCVLAEVMGTKLALLGHRPILGDLAVESGIFAFLLLVVMSSAVRPNCSGRTRRTGWCAMALSR